MTSRFVLFPILAVLCFGAGCASVKTVPDASAARSTIHVRRPEVIWVQPFRTDGGMWQGSATSPERRTEIRDWLTGSLQLHLNGIAPTRLLEGEMPTVGWLVTGRFLRVNPGSRVGRMFLGGIGQGASKLETRVEVFDLAVSSTEPILGLTTSGGSNLVGGIPGAMTATDDDVERTAREIRVFLESHLWPDDSEQGRPSQPAAMDEIQIAPRRSQSR